VEEDLAVVVAVVLVASVVVPSAVVAVVESGNKIFNPVAYTPTSFSLNQFHVTKRLHPKDD
jgi:hypothetical protein